MALLCTPLKNRVRAFLNDAGAPPRADLSHNYEQICIAMQRRREDDAFWERLTELVRELVDSVLKSKSSNAPLPPEARFLALWDVNELARLLRAALPHEADADESPLGAQAARFSRGLSPNGLGLCLLLSLAASACGGSDSHASAGDAGGTSGIVVTGGASAGLATGGAKALGGTPSMVTGGSRNFGGTHGPGGTGGAAGGFGGSVGIGGGGAVGGASTSGGASASVASGGSLIATAGGSIAIATGGSAHTGGSQNIGGSGGVSGVVSGGTVATGGSHNAAGTQAAGGSGGTPADTGGNNGTGGVPFSCTDPGGAAGATAVGGHPLPASCCVDTASALWQEIDASTLDSTQKQQLYTCFANLNATWCDGLVDLFANATPQVIAQTLSDLLICCNNYQTGKLTGDFANARQDILNRLMCSVALYKGVTFPT